MHKSVEEFVEQWRSGEIVGLPFVSVSITDLYQVYHAWCLRHASRDFVSMAAFGKTLPSLLAPHDMVKRIRSRWRCPGVGEYQQGQVYKYGIQQYGIAEADYLGQHIEQFRTAAASLGLWRKM